MHVECLGQPCRNFNILGIERIVDPRDGREKAVLSNFASGETGNVIILDPATGEGESLPLPGDEGAWAVLNLDNETLLVGTCSCNGYLHRLDLRTRQWDKPLRVETENYIWNLCRGPDGLVYGGTYPGCVLLRYDPSRRVLENLGRLSDNKDNLYSRFVYATPDHILCNIISAEPHVVAYALGNGAIRRLGAAGAQVSEVNDRWVCLSKEQSLEFFDARTLAPIAAPPKGALPPWQSPYPGGNFSVCFADGRRLFVRGQEYGVMRDGEARPALVPIPTERPATDILTIAADERGTVWGSSGFGQTIFSYDPRAGRHWNSSAVCDKGGEVYGIVPLGGRLFLSTYCGGDHVVYDPARPWDQVGNVNPRTLASAETRFCRPDGKSVLGPDGAIWTGWMAGYGVYGGGLSRVDPNTLAVTSWYDPFPEEALCSVAADARHVYFTTSGAANGLAARERTLHFAVWDPVGRIVWSHTFEPPEKPGHVWAAHGRVLVVVGSVLRVFNPDTLSFVGEIETEKQTATAVLPLADGQALVFCWGGGVWQIDLRAMTSRALGTMPGTVHSATRAPDGAIYAASGSQLYRVTP